MSHLDEPPGQESPVWVMCPASAACTITLNKARSRVLGKTDQGERGARARLQVRDRHVLERGGWLLHRLRARPRQLCGLGYDIRGSAGPGPCGHPGGPGFQAKVWGAYTGTDAPASNLGRVDKRPPPSGGIGSGGSLARQLIPRLRPTVFKRPLPGGKSTRRRRAPYGIVASRGVSPHRAGGTPDEAVGARRGGLVPRGSGGREAARLAGARLVLRPHLLRAPIRALRKERSPCRGRGGWGIGGAGPLRGRRRATATFGQVTLPQDVPADSVR